MPVIANHDLSTRAIVGQKQHKGVLPLSHFLDLIEDSANFDIHAVNHRRVNCHLGSLELLLSFV